MSPRGPGIYGYLLLGLWAKQIQAKGNKLAPRTPGTYGNLLLGLWAEGKFGHMKEGGVATRNTENQVYLLLGLWPRQTWASLCKWHGPSESNQGYLRLGLN